MRYTLLALLFLATPALALDIGLTDGGTPQVATPAPQPVQTGYTAPTTVEVVTPDVCKAKGLQYVKGFTYTKGAQKGKAVPAKCRKLPKAKS